jgi:acyl-CoA synthetase (NDP forming)
VDGPAALRRAYRDLDSRLGSSLDGVLVQEMAFGVEMLLGTLRDPFFGPLVACGVGGTAVELESDVGYRRAPISENEASSLLRSLRGTPRLEGYRGAPLADVAALVDALLRVAALTALSPEVLEMDVNPFVVCGSGARAVDVHLRLVAPSPPHRRKLASF